MKNIRKLACIVLFFHLFGTVLCAQTGAISGATPPEPWWKIEALGSMGFGSTIYELNALAPDPSGSGSIVPIRSRLEFPVDALYGGARLTGRPGVGSLGRWGFSLSVFVNLNDPSSKMVNSDYVNGPEVIHTESSAQLDYIAGNAEIMYRLVAGEEAALDLFLSTEYERIEELMVDYSGWQTSLFTGTKFSISGTGPVLEYRVTYVNLLSGVEWKRRLGGAVTIHLTAAGGIVFASDYDDHTMRGRTSAGSGTGVGLTSTVGVKLLPGSLPIDWLSLALRGGIKYYYAEGGMDQTLSSGTEYLDIPYVFESLRTQIGIVVGYEF